MQQRGQQPSFPPIYSSTSTALILGSYPSPKSFEAGFYYYHPRNRFWPLLAQLVGSPLPETIPQRKQLLLENNLALWDSLESCQISGAADHTITNPVPNNIAALLKQTNIQHIFCNGNAAFKFYEKYCGAQTDIKAICLPSTSPANAAYTLPRLLEAWQPLVAALG